MRLCIIALLALAFWAREDLEFWWHSYGPGDCRTDTECSIKYPDYDDGPCESLPPDHPDSCE